MNRHNNRFPRTMEEAFGPYERNGFVEPYTPMHKSDKIILVGSFIGLIALGVMALVGWI